MSPDTLAPTNRIPCAGQAPQPGPRDPCSSWYHHRRQYHGALRALPSGQASAGSGHPQKPWITRCAAATGPTAPEDRQSPRKNAPTLRGTQTSPRAPAPGPPDGPAGLSRLTRSATRICRTASNRLSPPNMLHPPGPRTPLPACRGIRKGSRLVARLTTPATAGIPCAAIRFISPLLVEYHTPKYAPHHRK